MLNLNRRHTEALEKSAKAEERIADAEEIIARNLPAILKTKPAHVGSQKKASNPSKAAPPNLPNK